MPAVATRTVILRICYHRTSCSHNARHRPWGRFPVDFRHLEINIYEAIRPRKTTLEPVSQLEALGKQLQDAVCSDEKERCPHKGKKRRTLGNPGCMYQGGPGAEWAASISLPFVTAKLEKQETVVDKQSCVASLRLWCRRSIFQAKQLKASRLCNGGLMRVIAK